MYSMDFIVGKLPESLNDVQFAYDVEGEIAKYIAKSDCEPK
jgi:hypothetical protein